MGRKTIVDVGTARDEERARTFAAWRRLVNMSRAELLAFLARHGDEAGLSRPAAAAQGIRSGRDSARAILRMLDKLDVERAREATLCAARAAWTPGDWRWASRQVSFVRRAKGQAAAVDARQGEGAAWVTSTGRPSRLLLALNLWGHKPQGKVARR